MREIPVLNVLLASYANLIQFDHPGWVKDASNQILNYIRIENDPLDRSVMSSGTETQTPLLFNGSSSLMCTNFVLTQEIIVNYSNT